LRYGLRRFGRSSNGYVCDTIYGVGDIKQQLSRAGRGYVLGVNSAHVFRSWGKRPPVTGTAADIARTRRSSDWKRLLAGAGTKGPRLHDWCYLELADLEAEETNSANQGLWTRGLLIRRRIADGDLAFFTTPGVRLQPIAETNRLVLPICHRKTEPCRHSDPTAVVL
jgi:SRSO17 transposase